MVFQAKQVVHCSQFGLFVIKSPQDIGYYLRQDVLSMLTTGIPLTPNIIKDFPLNHDGFFDKNGNVDFLQHGMVIRDLATSYYRPYQSIIPIKPFSILDKLPPMAQCLYLDDVCLVYLFERKIHIWETVGHKKHTIIPLDLKSYYADRTSILFINKDYFILSLYDGNMIFMVNRLFPSLTLLSQQYNWDNLEYIRLAREIIIEEHYNTIVWKQEKIRYNVEMTTLFNMYQYQLIFLSKALNQEIGLKEKESWYLFSTKKLSGEQLDKFVPHILINDFQDGSLIQTDTIF